MTDPTPGNRAAAWTCLAALTLVLLVVLCCLGAAVVIHL